MGVAIVVPGADFRANNVGSVTPTRTLALEAVAVIGPATAFVSAQYVAAFVPTFTTQRAVVWSIASGAAYATIDNNGLLTVRPGVSGETVTIRCTSAVDANIYAEKSIQVTSVELAYYDWITSDGTDFIVMPGLPGKTSGRVIVRSTLTGANTYVWMCQFAANSSQASLGAYNNGSNKVSAIVGNAGFLNYVNKVSDVIYRYEWDLGLSSTGAFHLYDDATSQLLGSRASANIEMSGLVYIFRYGVGASSESLPADTNPSLTPVGAKFYGMVVYDANNNKMAEYKPAVYNGTAGVYDTVSGIFRGGHSGTDGLTCGNDE